MTKICTQCKIEKSLIEFPNNKRYKGGFKRVCKKCDAIYKQQYRKQNPDIIRDGELRSHYGLTLKQHKEMYISQNGCCPLCDKSIPYDEIDTDHCHVTNRVRGLLCNGCNSRLGWFEKRKEKVLNYIK